MKSMKLVLCVVAVLLGCLFVSEAQAQRNAYGGLYVVDGATTQALSTTAAKLTAFTAATETSSPGDGSVVPSATNDNIALLAGGVYLIHLDVTASVGTADIQVTYGLRNGATAITGAECRHEAEAADVPSNASLTWLYKPSAAATLNVYVESESSTPDLTVIDSQLVVVRLQ